MDGWEGLLVYHRVLFYVFWCFFIRLCAFLSLRLPAHVLLISSGFFVLFSVSLVVSPVVPLVLIITGFRWISILLSTYATPITTPL